MTSNEYAYKHPRENVEKKFEAWNIHYVHDLGNRICAQSGQLPQHEHLSQALAFSSKNNENIPEYNYAYPQNRPSDPTQSHCFASERI